MEDDAVLLMELAHEITHLRAQNALHGASIWRHHMNFDVTGAAYSDGAMWKSKAFLRALLHAGALLEGN